MKATALQKHLGHTPDLRRLIKYPLLSSQTHHHCLSLMQRLVLGSGTFTRRLGKMGSGEASTKSKGLVLVVLLPA